MNKDRVIKALLILFAVYGSLSFMNYYNNTQDQHLLEKILLITFVITLINSLYPTL